MRSFIRRCLLFLATMNLLMGNAVAGYSWSLPVKTENRINPETLKLTKIGAFGLKRKSRPKVPAHLHTGIDIKRPGKNYIDEPIFPVNQGVVISLRTDGPFAQIIIQHSLSDQQFVWSVYEHIAGVSVKLGDNVDPDRPIARFMNKKELQLHGWQFDHVHFEILKSPPPKRDFDNRIPSCHYATYSIVCYNRNDLEMRYYDPLEFLIQNWQDNSET